MILPVAAAYLTDEEGRILLCRRRREKARGGLWEFPGGKTEGNETPREALRRELKEELDIEAAVYSELARGIYAYGDVTIELILMEARKTGGTLNPVDHDRLAWVLPEHLAEYDLAPADKMLLPLLF